MIRRSYLVKRISHAPYERRFTSDEIRGLKKTRARSSKGSGSCLSGPAAGSDVLHEMRNRRRIHVASHDRGHRNVRGFLAGQTGLDLVHDQLDRH